jgi:hypothetical protein
MNPAIFVGLRQDLGGNETVANSDYPLLLLSVPLKNAFFPANDIRRDKATSDRNPFRYDAPTKPLDLDLSISHNRDNLISQYLMNSFS